MNQFFFISTYDSVSKEILRSIINLYPNVCCVSSQDKSFLPNTAHDSIDQFIEMNSQNGKNVSGSIGDFSTYELLHKTIIQRPKHEFKCIHIIMSPIQRIRFILYAWQRSGLSYDQISKEIEHELEKDINNNGVLKLYHVIDYYNVMTNALSVQINHIAKSNPSHPNINKVIASITSSYGKLFLFATAIVMAFDSADIHCPIETFKFETLLTDESELIEMFNYILNEKSTYSNEFVSYLKAKLSEIYKFIDGMLIEPWELWQTELLNGYTDKALGILYSPCISSQYFANLSRIKALDVKNYGITNKYLFIKNQNTYYLLVQLTPFEDMKQKDKVINDERIRYVKEFDARLLFDVSYEALTFSEDTHEYWIKFHTILQESGIPGEKVFIMSSNYNAAKYYSEWANKHNLVYRINALGNNLALFQRAHEIEFNPIMQARRNDLIYSAKRTIEKNERRPKYFMCLNLKCRDHRTALLLFFLDRGYLDKGIITYFGRHSLNPEEDDIRSATKQLSQKPWDTLISFVKQLPDSEKLLSHYDLLEKLRPIVYDKQAKSVFVEDWPLQQLIPEIGFYGDIKHIDTYFEVVTETYFLDEKTLNITEKVLRTFLRFQIFIIVGSPFTLKYLKNIGFQTFSPYVDESYDSIIDPGQRMTAIMKEIDRMCALTIDELHDMYCVLWPRILHNFNHYTNNMRVVCEKEANELLATLL